MLKKKKKNYKMWNTLLYPDWSEQLVYCLMTTYYFGSNVMSITMCDLVVTF